MTESNECRPLSSIGRAFWEEKLTKLRLTMATRQGERAPRFRHPEIQEIADRIWCDEIKPGVCAPAAFGMGGLPGPGPGVFLLVSMDGVADDEKYIDMNLHNFSQAHAINS